MSLHKKFDSLTNCLLSVRSYCLRMRRFLRARKESKPPEPEPEPAEKRCKNIEMGASEMIHIDKGLVEKLKGSDDDCWMVALQKSVKMLHFGTWGEKEAAAGEIKVLSEEGVERRKIMAELGVIPPLVDMVGSEVAARRRLAVAALIALANGSFTSPEKRKSVQRFGVNLKEKRFLSNKALMVEAGIMSKLPENIRSMEESDKEIFSHLLLSVSSLSTSQFSLSSSRIISIVLSILESTPSTETKQSCLATLHNLSCFLDNTTSLTSPEVIDNLVSLSMAEHSSEKALATLSTLVVTSSGRKSLENNPVVPEGFIEIMTWEEKPKCQELSAYILMILAHHSSLLRQKMAKAGVVQVLLEVALLGSPLAQKRSLRILQWFKDERQTRVGPHSGPQITRSLTGSSTNEAYVEQGKMVMKRIVKQSLYQNMEKITRRANGGVDSSRLKGLVVSSSSKSLPY